MRIGINYISYVYNDGRARMAERSLKSLAKTTTEGLERPHVRISFKPSDFQYYGLASAMGEKFDVSLCPDPPHYSSMSYAAMDSALKLLAERPDVTHIFHTCDDRLFNPMWLIELVKLIERHPDGVAWNVYRSATTAYHRIVGGDGHDVLMSMHDALGCTTRAEWFKFYECCGYGHALDIMHAQWRPGNRWATNRDYIQNLGVHFESDWAIDFVGE